MLSVRKRNRVCWLEGRVKGERIQVSLGTRNYDNAVQYSRVIERALAVGATSEEWPRLRNLLPASVFEKLSALVEYVEHPVQRPPEWEDLQAAFVAECERSISLGRMRDSTWARYQHSLEEFKEFLEQAQIRKLVEISKTVVEQFKVWRMDRIKKRKFSRGGRGLTLDIAILHRIFSYAIESELVMRNPVRLEGRPGDEPECGAQPFKADELARLREAAGPDLITFLLLRWTGLRGSDAVRLRWTEVDFQSGEITRLTLKRRKRVVVPMHTELSFALEAEAQRRCPSSSDTVLLNPYTGTPLTRPRLYERMLALGRRANVADAHPHRFRDTFCVDCLARGVNPYSVAKLIGITVEMLEKHYAPFVPELRDRVRTALESGSGLESIQSEVRNGRNQSIEKLDKLNLRIQ
jgi:site-specific recombinase XerD